MQLEVYDGQAYGKLGKYIEAAMSDRLAVSAAFSVLMMASYVLLGGDSVRAPLDRGSAISPMQISTPAINSGSVLLR